MHSAGRAPLVAVRGQWPSYLPLKFARRRKYGDRLRIQNKQVLCPQELHEI